MRTNSIIPMFGGSYDGTRIRSLAGQTLMYNTNASTEITRAKANGNGMEHRLMEQKKPVGLYAQDYVKDRQFTDSVRTGADIRICERRITELRTPCDRNIDKDKGQFFGYKDTTHEVKVFYIEKWWGNRWDRINGLLMVGGEILAKDDTSIQSDRKGL